MAVVGIASTGEQALGLAETLRPDVMLVDIDLGDESGLDVARRLSASPAAPQVILISTHAGEDYAGLIEASPAIGFLSKPTLSARAVQELLAGSGPGTSGVGVSEPRGR